MVLKPAEWSPLTASLLADITAEAGLPPGVFNVVQGLGEEVGPTLTGHPDVSRISFTGSVPTARSIAQSAAANLTPCSFELGGKSPFIVFADTDMESAVVNAVEQYDNAGQVCLAGVRLLVESSIRDEFVGRFVDASVGAAAGRPTRAGHRRRAAGQSASTSSGWTVSSQRAVADGRRGADRRRPQRRSRWAVLPADPVRRGRRRQRRS